MRPTMVTKAQRKAHQKHEATREKRVAIWCAPSTAKKVDRAAKKLGLPSREAWVLHALTQHSAPAQSEQEKTELRIVVARNFETDFDAVLDALSEWPKLPSPSVLRFLSQSGDYAQDWSNGKHMQSELEMGRIPYVCECEIGAGFWHRITKGEWRSAESARAQKPTVREPVQAHPDKAHDGAET